MNGGSEIPGQLDLLEELSHLEHQDNAGDSNSFSEPEHGATCLYAPSGHSPTDDDLAKLDAFRATLRATARRELVEPGEPSGNDVP